LLREAIGTSRLSASVRRLKPAICDAGFGLDGERTACLLAGSCKFAVRRGAVAFIFERNRKTGSKKGGRDEHLVPSSLILILPSEAIKQGLLNLGVVGEGKKIVGKRQKGPPPPPAMTSGMLPGPTTKLPPPPPIPLPPAPPTAICKVSPANRVKSPPISAPGPPIPIPVRMLPLPPCAPKARI
jgi:hypothetical protein